MHHSLEFIAMLASAGMPLFNIPLIVRIVRRRSSQDLSLTWLLGVYACILLMFPYALLYGDAVLRLFSCTNTTLFTGVVVATLWFRVKK